MCVCEQQSEMLSASRWSRLSFLHLLTCCQNMDCTQQTTHTIRGSAESCCRLKFVNFEAHENHISHETEGLSQKLLVVRRGKPFKVTLMFRGRPWDRLTERLVLQVCLGDMSERIPVQFCDERPDPQAWSARVHPADVHLQSVGVHLCSPVLSSVALYQLLVHIEARHSRRSYTGGAFVLLCNPWLREDPVHMPLDVQIQEYVRSDYGLVYMGTHLNINRRPWSFGQYEPGVLEACLTLLQLSPQHLRDQDQDYVRRADPVYLSRVVCAMVNCNDDLGVLEGRWQGGYTHGVKPTEWSGSADILRRWVASSCRPVRYGQCWVFASVLCTVMRVLGIPSRVVTVFNAAHDGDGSLKIEEYYSSRGEKLNLSKDSVWNFHVWVECWMRRPDLGPGFNGWQVVDPTPQEKSAGVYCCGPCPVAAVQRRCLGAPFDTSFIYASVDADVVQLMVRDGLVVGRKVDTEGVGQLIYTKSVGSDRPENLTHVYKGLKKRPPAGAVGAMRAAKGSALWSSLLTGGAAGCPFTCSTLRSSPVEASPSLDVSLNIDGTPTLGESIIVCVTVTNLWSSSRVLKEHLNVQLKEFDRNPQQCFCKKHRELHVQPREVLTLHHTVPPSEYEAFLAGDDIVNLAVVIKDVRTKERVLATQEFNIRSPQISIQIDGGDSIQVKKEHSVQVSFINRFSRTLTGAVLTVEGSGLMPGRQEARLVLLPPGEKIEKLTSIVASSPGTKVLMATFSHSHSHSVVSRSFCKVSVTTE